MAKPKTVWVCSKCGRSQSHWSGQCPGCRSWNTMEEHQQEAAPAGAVRQAGARTAQAAPVIDLAKVRAVQEERDRTGIGEFDRVLGGGVVRGGVVLAGGEPGVGKSTLFLQAARRLADTGTVLYVSGEESPSQIKVRADRLGISGGVLLMNETELSRILAGIAQVKPRFLIIDSIQTLYDAQLSSAPGSVTQVRGCASALAKTAKAEGISTFMIGHVTKEGALAGPRVLEHLVDTVLYFESERTSNLRVLRAVKNRFGSTDEIGLFEMRDTGMTEMTDTASLFENTTGQPLEGAAVFCATQGNRPMLLEIQALCAHTQLNVPRRLASGLDSNRLYMLCAVMEKRMGLKLYSQDVFVNVAGGIRISEHASDLALAAAVVSSLRGAPISPETALIGEVGLSGEVRRVSRMEQRLAECRRMGMRRVIVPRQGFEKPKQAGSMKIEPVASLFEAFEKVLG
ncbi:MAG: DNA repair protein RadA [Clostridia bacterium]|nr:DNA repair protein RadA [Clostridia bacterium]